MRRRLLNLFATTSLLLCVALVAIEFAGGWSDRSGRTHRLVSRWTYGTDGANGRIQLVLFHHSPTTIVGPVLPMGASKELDAWIKRFPPYARWYPGPFGFECGPSLGTDAARRATASGTRTWLMAPYWAVQLLLLLPPTLTWLPRLLRRRHLSAPGHCPRCGYDLRATPDRCPECGAVPLHAGAERSAAPDFSIRPVPLVLVILFLTLSARAADPTVTLYSPDPAHPWNRLHATLFLRTAPTGETFGLDELDPLLWSGTRHHLLEDPSRATALTALDAAIAAPLIQDPLKRAVLQRDLWSVFDWNARNRDASAPLQQRLVLLLRRIALTADEIRALPDMYAATAASHRFPAADDPEHPNTPFLPPDLFDPAGPWIPLRHAGDNDDGTIAPDHSGAFGERSVFEAYFRHPAGRQAGLDYLARLAAYTRTGPKLDFTLDPNLPQFPAGTAFALVRRALLFDRDGRLHPTHLVESVQLRVYRHTDRTTRAHPAQSFHEFELSRAGLLADPPDPAAALRPLARDEQGFPFLRFHSMGIDPFEQDAPHPESHPRYTAPPLGMCDSCHSLPGVMSVNSFTRFIGPRTPHPALAESPPDLQPTLTIQRKQSRPEWKLLRDLITP